MVNVGPIKRTALFDLEDLFTALSEELVGKPYGYISDIYVQQATTPFFYRCGVFCPPSDTFMPSLKGKILSKEDMSNILNKAWSHNEEKGESKRDFAFNWDQKNPDGTVSHWRIRTHLSSNYRGEAACFRLLQREIPDLEDLDIPTILRDMAIRSSTGLLVVSGATGSGKSTTLASIIKGYARERRGHIATLEDPVEYVYDFPDRLVTQQVISSIEKDSNKRRKDEAIKGSTWGEAIRGTLKDKVELLLISELTDADSVRAAVQAASSGHIVLASAHFTSSIRVLTYLESLFPQEEKESMRMALVDNLIGVCCQKLLPSEEGGVPKVVPCYELLVSSPTLANNLRTGSFANLGSLMDPAQGCVRWDDRLDVLFRNRIIDSATYELNSRKEKEITRRSS